jgi:hypothetical protein
MEHALALLLMDRDGVVATNLNMGRGKRKSEEGREKSEGGGMR